MASTYKWSDLINYVAQSHPRLQADAAGAMLCDMVNSLVWGRADWRVSLATLPPFYLVGGVQDYYKPYLSLPTDFLGLRGALLTMNTAEPPLVFPPLTVDRYLQKTTMQGRTTAISYEATTSGLRIFPRPPVGLGPMDWQVETTYKKNPVKVTAATLFSTGPVFDDQYFNIFVEGLKYFIKPPAQQNVNDLANFVGMIDVMAAHEAINLGEQPVSPREPLVDWW